MINRLVKFCYLLRNNVLIYFKLTKQKKRKSNKKWQRIRKAILKSNNGSFTCFYCGKTLTHSITIDHIISVSKGGNMYDKKNLVIACYKCNIRKSDLTLDEFKKTKYYKNRMNIVKLEF